MGFTKLDEGIVLSSIWSESLATRVVWITILAMCDENGFVSCSRVGLMRSANVPKEGFDKAIIILESPDKDSRSPEYEGRRIEKCDGGWTVLNYKKYRQFSYSKSKEAVKKRKYRERKKGTQGDMSQNGGDISASVSSLKYLNEISLNKGIDEIETIKLQWNEFAEKHGLALIKGIEKKTVRYSNLNARMKSKDFDFKVLLTLIGNSPFLLGQIKEEFRVFFDWIIKPTNYPKIIEGTYLDKKKETYREYIDRKKREENEK